MSLSLGNLFGSSEEDLLAVAAVVPEKKAAKPEQKKKEAKAKMFRLPVTLRWLDRTTVVEGIGEIAESELKKKASDAFMYPTKVLALTEEDGEVKVYPVANADPAPKDTEGWEVCYEGFVMPAAATVEETAKLWAEQYPEFKGCAFLYDTLTRTMFPIVKEAGVGEEVIYPCSYRLFGGETVTGFMPSSLTSSPAATKDEPEGFDLDDDSDDKATKAQVDAAATRTWRISDLKGEFKKLFKYNVKVVKDGDGYVIFPGGSITAPAAVKKEEKKFPTEGTQLSLMLRHIPLEPSMFAGRKEVTAEQLLTWLTPQYPEYSKERTHFEYDEKNRLIIAILKGASKG